MLVNDTIVVVTGKVDVREGEAPVLLVEDIKPYTQPDKYAGKRLYVRVGGYGQFKRPAPHTAHLAGGERVSVKFEHGQAVKLNARSP